MLKTDRRTRMHSSRMQWLPGRSLFRGVPIQGGHCLESLCPGGPPSRRVPVQRGLCPGGVSVRGDPSPSSLVNRMNDTHFWKHYLPLCLVKIYIIITTRNSSCIKVMFSQACVIPAVHRGCDIHSPMADTPLGRHPLGRHPLGRHPTPGRHSQGIHPQPHPWAGSPPGPPQLPQLPQPPPSPPRPHSKRWPLKWVVRILLECILV